MILRIYEELDVNFKGSKRIVDTISKRKLIMMKMNNVDKHSSIMRMLTKIMSMR